jgi:carbamoyltransferase
MIILGISGGHDANWCVVKDGLLLGAFEKERFTRRRHDSGEIVSLLGRSLAFLGLQPNDIDILATSEPVHRGKDPGHRHLSGSSYQHIDDWQWQVAECFGRILPCLSIPHHLAHAAYAHYTSGFESRPRQDLTDAYLSRCLD